MRIRLTRAQLVTQNACAEGLDLFDQMAPKGVLSTDREDVIASWEKQAQSWLNWLTGLLPVGYGYGSGYGYGDGSGSGSGSGYGYGSGSGYGSGDGSGDDVVRA